MSLEITTHLNIDFNDDRYILISAKQKDDNSRWLTIACYNNGELFKISESKYSVYIRYKKPNGYGGINSCRINHRGEALVELTYDMLSSTGVCDLDLIIADKGSAVMNVNTGKISYISNSSILSTMKFQVYVHEEAIDNSIIEAMPEYMCLTEAIEKAEADFREVILSAKSWAVGNAENIREDEDVDNSKYYSKLSESYTHGGTGLAARNTSLVKEATDNAKYYNELAESYAKGYTENDIREGEDEDNSKHYYELARSYTNGDNGKRDGEETDNARYYNEQAYNSANAADISEANALSYMNTSKSHRDAAETAQGKSEEAQQKAETAQQKSEAAQSKSESAQQKAETAQQKAEAAQSAAETAKQGAEAAKSELETARDEAKIAQQKAEAAQAAAEEAEQNAENAAQNVVNNNLVSVSEMKSYLGI